MHSDRSDDDDLLPPLVRVGQVVDAEMPWSKHRVKAALFGDPVVPPTVGQYEIRGTLGRGGMGVVLDAFDSTLNRRVALKLLSPRLSEDEAATARLLREAQALARLSHPNVVHVYETGTTDDGQVYLAMERVEGQTLHAWQDAAPRSWRECLEMYLQAGEGLAAAHAEGLVHRDFKPSNCMVDAKGRVRVLDFGLALALDEGEVDAAGPSGPSNETAPIMARLTRRGTLVGTLAYMAPEQLAGLPTDPRSDQFSFCVSLYEALCGRMPFAGDSISARHEAIRLGRPEPAPRVVPRAVLGVVRRGLAFEPEQRHRDLPGLLQALRRVPLRRKRERLAGMVAVGMVGVAGSWMAIAPSPCDGVREQPPSGWDEAQRESVATALRQRERAASGAAQVVVEDLDAYAAAWQQDRFEACMEQSESPELASRRRACLDRLDGKLGALTNLLARSDGPGIAQAVAAARDLKPSAACGLMDGRGYGAAPTPEQQDAVAEARKQIDEAQVYLLTEQADTGRKVARELLPRARATEHDATVVEVLVMLGRHARKAGDLADARESLLEAVGLAERDGADVWAIEALIDLVHTMIDGSNVRAAEDWLRLVEGKVGRVGEPEYLVPSLSSVRGRVAYANGRFDEAVPHYRSAVEQWVAKSSDGDLRAATARNNLAAALVGAGRYGEARAVHAELLDRLDERLASPGALADYQHNLAELELADGKPKAAARGFARSVELLRDAGEIDGPNVAKAELSISYALAQSGDAEGAARHASAAAAAADSVEPADPLRASIESQRAFLCYASGDFRCALEAYRRQAAIMAAGDDSDPIQIAMLESNMGEVALKLGELDTADSYFARALAVLESKLGPDDGRLAYPLRGRAEVLMLRREFAAARPLLERALRIREANRRDAYDLAAIRWAMARLLLQAPSDELPLVRPRAIELARAARDGLVDLDPHHALIREIDSLVP